MLNKGAYILSLNRYQVSETIPYEGERWWKVFAVDEVAAKAIVKMDSTCRCELSDLSVSLIQRNIKGTNKQFIYKHHENVT